MPNPMFGAVISKFLGNLFISIIRMKGLQGLQDFSFQHGMKLLKVLKYLVFLTSKKYTHVFLEASSIKVTKYLYPLILLTCMGPQTSEYTSSSIFYSLVDLLLNETLC